MCSFWPNEWRDGRPPAVLRTAMVGMLAKETLNMGLNAKRLCLNLANIKVPVRGGSAARPRSWVASWDGPEDLLPDR